MSNKTFLDIYQQGKGYDEELVVSFNELQILFKYFTYNLVEEVNGELQLNLNFGGTRFIPHAVKKIANMIVLVPRFYDVNSERYVGRQMYLDINTYLDLIASQVFIFSQKDLENLWRTSRNSLHELESVTVVNNEDCFLLWLLSSGFKATCSSTTFIKDYSKSLASNIIAEDTDCQPSVKRIIHKIVEGSLIFDNSQLLLLEKEPVITAHILETDNSVREWKAVLASNCFTCILAREYGINLVSVE